MLDKDKIKSSGRGVQAPTTRASQSDDKATKRYVFYMVSAMVLIAIVGGVIIYQLASAYVVQTNKNKAQDLTIGLLEKKQDDLAKLQPNYDAIITKGPSGKSDADLILNAMPTDEGYKQLIAMIERMGQESGIQIPAVTKTTGTTVTSQAAGATPYQISISMNGTFAQVLEFIKKTENSSRVIDFVSMNVNGSTKSGPIQATATFTVFWQKPADIAPTQKELQ